MSDEYLPDGFTNVDGAKDAAAFSSCLTLIDSLPYFQHWKERSYELLKLGEGDRVLDAGCGLGDDAYRMAERVGGSGRVIGFDASEKLIARARADERSARLPVEFQLGDLRQLPFAEGAFTRCRIDRVLQHVPNPRTVVTELVRVLAPGGLLLAYDNDWGTFSLTSSEKGITRMLENAWCDSFVNAWIGRELRGYFAEARLTDIAVHPGVFLIEDFAMADQLYNLRQTVRRAIDAGRISEAEGAAWLAELQTRSDAGSFTVSLTAYTVVGRKKS